MKARVVYARRIGDRIEIRDYSDGHPDTLRVKVTNIARFVERFEERGLPVRVFLQDNQEVHHESRELQ